MRCIVNKLFVENFSFCKNLSELRISYGGPGGMDLPFRQNGPGHRNDCRDEVAPDTTKNLFTKDRENVF